MNTILNLSAGPHTKGPLTTKRIMYIVICALVPTSLLGIWSHGMHSALVILISVLTAVVSEYAFCMICGKPSTISDGSAALTGLLLALVLPPSIPLYIPFFGSLFAIVVAKCCFGGLGKNFMNPALAGRCFVLISFGKTVSTFKVDGISAATPTATLRAGRAVNISAMFRGTANGVIGSSVMAVLIGGLVLWMLDIISGYITFSILITFVLFLGLFGGQGFDPNFLLAHLCDSVIMGAFFMATDYATSPVSRSGQIIYGALIGMLGALFRMFGSAADSFSYAIITGNMVVPLIDTFLIPKPYAYRAGAIEMQKYGRKKTLREKIPSPVIVLGVITLLLGFALSGVYTITKDTIEEKKLLANKASYQAVLPEAETFEADEAVMQKISDLGGEVYGTSFGRAYINSAVAGKDASGKTVGYAVSVTSADGFDGNITLSIGIDPEGRVLGISFTELNETPGMGMRADEPAFKDQFAGRMVDSFLLNRSGVSSKDNEIDSVSGASTTSGAVVKAVNAGLDFFNNVLKGGAGGE